MNKFHNAPRHISVIMDGNRRWAKGRGFPVEFGHASGAKRIRGLVEACYKRGIKFITVFAFSTENWKRPVKEVSFLLDLFALYLRKEINDMSLKGVRFKVIGDTSKFSPQIQVLIKDAQASTAHNDSITLTIAANFGGRWDMLQASKAWQHANPGKTADLLDEKSLAPYLSMAYAPDPDLLIRTGGESRLSNFMLWQQAYTELFFTDLLWPDFCEKELDRALAWFYLQDRRFGGCSTQAISVPLDFVA